MPPSFTSVPLEPGSYPKVTLQSTATIVPTNFATALIGRTSLDKPALKKLVRNEVNTVEFDVDQTSEALSAGVDTVGGDTVFEPRRMDTLEFVTNQTDISEVDSAIDNSGIAYLEGEDQDWVSYFMGAAGYAKAWLIDWATRFRFAKYIDSASATTAQHVPIEGPAGSGAIIQFARVQKDSEFSYASPLYVQGDELTGITPATYGLTVNAPAGKYVLAVRQIPGATGTDHAFAFVLRETDPNTGLLPAALSGDPFGGTLPDGTILLNLGTTPRTLGSMTATASPTNNLAIKGASNVSYDPSATGGNDVIELLLKSDSGYTLPVLVDLDALSTDADNHFLATGNYNWYDLITVTAAGPSSGNGGSVGTIPPDGIGSGKAGTRYSINYRKQKNAADITTALFDTTGDVQDFHGKIGVSTTPDTLSFGAEVYFRQGGTSVWCVPLRDILIDPVNGFDLTNDAGYVSAVEDALETLEKTPEATMVIVLSPTETGSFRSGILSAVKSHVLRMGQQTEAKPRAAIMGARANTTSEAVFTTNAEFESDNHLFYVAPATAPLTIGGTTIIGDGSSIAAAIAGSWSDPSFDAGSSFNGIAITAFDDIADPFTRVQKNRMGESHGVLIIEKKSGSPVTRDFVTSDPSDILHSDGRVTRLEIDVRNGTKTLFDNAMVNKRFTTGEAISLAQNLLKMYRDAKVANREITDLRVDSMSANASNPSEFDIAISIVPIFIIKWIPINITIKTS